MNMFKDAYEELERIRHLEKGWDGYRGAPFSPELINHCKAVINQLEQYCADHCVMVKEICTGLASDGSIDIEVHYKNKSMFLIFYPDSYKDTFQVYKKEAAEQKETVSFPFPDISVQFTWLFS